MFLFTASRSSGGKRAIKRDLFVGQTRKAMEGREHRACVVSWRESRESREERERKEGGGGGEDRRKEGGIRKEGTKEKGKRGK